jgi:hypothetical protein
MLDDFKEKVYEKEAFKSFYENQMKEHNRRLTEVAESSMSEFLELSKYEKMSLLDNPELARALYDSISEDSAKTFFPKFFEDLMPSGCKIIDWAQVGATYAEEYPKPKVIFETYVNDEDELNSVAEFLRFISKNLVKDEDVDDVFCFLAKRVESNKYKTGALWFPVYGKKYFFAEDYEDRDEPNSNLAAVILGCQLFYPESD